MLAYPLVCGSPLRYSLIHVLTYFLPRPVILEGILTTLNQDGSTNISPMGPAVDEQLSRFLLKPFRSSTTYRNLKRTHQAVFHITDNVEVLAQAAVGTPEPFPQLRDAEEIEGRILADACRWFALRVRSLDDQHERTEIECQVLDSGTIRDFFGFNRAKHAVLEAAILATRTDYLPANHILSEMERFEVIVQKTAGDAEQRAFDFLKDYIRGALIKKVK